MGYKFTDIVFFKVSLFVLDSLCDIFLRSLLLLNFLQNLDFGVELRWFKILGIFVIDQTLRILYCLDMKNKIW